MTQTTYDFVEWENLIRNSPKWSCNERQWWFRNFLPKMPLGKVEIFPIHRFKPLGSSFQMVIPGIMHKVNHFTR
jgi:hypothetical protein